MQLPERIENSATWLENWAVGLINNPLHSPALRSEWYKVRQNPKEHQEFLQKTSSMVYRTANLSGLRLRGLQLFGGNKEFDYFPKPFEESRDRKMKFSLIQDFFFDEIRRLLHDPSLKEFQNQQKQNLVVGAQVEEFLLAARIAFTPVQLAGITQSPFFVTPGSFSGGNGNINWQNFYFYGKQLLGSINIDLGDLSFERSLFNAWNSSTVEPSLFWTQSPPFIRPFSKSPLGNIRFDFPPAGRRNLVSSPGHSI